MLQHKQIIIVVVILTMLVAATTCSATAVAVPQTGQTSVYASGDDGDRRAGLPWPTPRFSDNGNQTVTDNLTGIIWAQSANSPGPAVCNPGGPKTWQAALDHVKCLNANNYLGYSDWFLPNRKEMTSLVNIQATNPGAWLNSQGFSNVPTAYPSGTTISDYWTSTTCANGTMNAWSVNMYFGDITGNGNGKTKTYFVWPARFVNPGTNIAKTGQTLIYATGDDGDLEKGIEWSSPRFTNSVDQTTITDNLTGLVWTKSGNAPGPQACEPAVTKTWQGGLDYIKCLNQNSYLGHSDWRLPNRKEMASLINIKEANPGAWLNSQGFIDVPTVYPSETTISDYWTSTTCANGTMNAWSVNMYFGDITGNGNSKAKTYFVWPVR